MSGLVAAAPRMNADDMSAAPMAERPAMIRLSGVSKFFEQRRSAAEAPVMNVALDRVDATIRAGEFVSLLGPSGCGKTTLLRIVAGLTRADEGVVEIGGETVEAPRRDSCMVFQNFGLLPWRSALGNVEFPLELDGVAPGKRREAARDLLDLVGLGRFADHFPHELSGGMQQRVSIARALIRRPVLILMDEPFGALDAQTREQLQEDFLKIWARSGTTVLFVTHSIDEALVLSDRIFVFSTNPGRITSIMDSPIRHMRLEGDVRVHPDFAPCRAELRMLLNGADA
jgi:NitT/TauT family transport system ATP-binding protein